MVLGLDPDASLAVIDLLDSCACRLEAVISLATRMKYADFGGMRIGEAEEGQYPKQRGGML